MEFFAKHIIIIDSEKYLNNKNKVSLHDKTMSYNVFAKKPSDETQDDLLRRSDIIIDGKKYLNNKNKFFYWYGK